MASAKAIISLNTLNFICEEIALSKDEKSLTGVVKNTNYEEVREKTKTKAKPKLCISNNQAKKRRKQSPKKSKNPPRNLQEISNQKS